MFQNVKSVATAGLSPRIINTLAGTFFVTFLGLLVAAATSAWAMTIPFLISGWGILATFIVALVMMFATKATSQTSMGLLPAFGFFAAMGAMMAAGIKHYLDIDPQVVVLAAASTAGLTLLLSGFVIVTRRNFNSMGGLLFVALLLLVIVGVINIFVQSSMLHLVLSYIGALVFSGYILYDTSKIVTGEYDNYIDASIGMFLNIANLFMNLLSIIGMNPIDD